jgi:hypothetical protein
MIQEYQIINSAILFELVAAVNREIEEGWQPIGGISIVIQKVNSKNEIVEEGKSTPIFYQAMIK